MWKIFSIKIVSVYESPVIKCTLSNLLIMVIGQIFIVSIGFQIKIFSLVSVSRHVTTPFISWSSCHFGCLISQYDESLAKCLDHQLSHHLMVNHVLRLKSSVSYSIRCHHYGQVIKMVKQVMQIS